MEDKSAMNSINTESLDAMIAEQVASHGPGIAVAIVRDGAVVYERCRGVADLEWNQPITPDTVVAVGSLTKTFTAQCVQLLAAAGKLDLSDAVAKHLPDLTWLDSQITIAHLLTHTSGIANYVTQPGFWENIAQHDHTPGELAAYIGTLARDFVPGENYSYSNSGYALLGMVIEAALGMPYEDALRAAIFEPLGMRDTRYLWDAPIIPRRAGGYMPTGQDASQPQYQHAPHFSPSLAFASGGLGSTVRDLIRWDAALRDQRLLPADVATRMTTPLTLNDGRRLGYGLGWGLARYRGHVVAHHAGGVPGFSSFYGRFTDDDLSIIVLSNIEGFDAGGLAARLVSAVLDLPSPHHQPAPGVSIDELTATVGGYSNYIGERLDVSVRDGSLVVSGDRAGSLIPLGNATFVLSGSPDTTIQFEALAADGYRRAMVTSPFYWFAVERTAQRR
jgi:CubicO group peptidase (beta-lactamase class C family)